MADITRMRSALRAISIEPYFLLYMFAAQLYGPAASALLYHKVCLELFNASQCAEISSGNNTAAENSVQAASSHWLLYQSLCFQIPAIFTSFFFGNLSDHVSRKYALLMPALGQVLNQICYVVTSEYVDSPVVYILIGELCSGIFGGWIVCLASSFSYICDVTTEEERTVRIAILEGAGTFSMVVSNFFGGLVLDHTSFTFVFSLSLALFTLSLLYVAFFVKDPPIRTPNGGLHVTRTRWQLLCRMCGPECVRSAGHVVLKPRDGVKRVHILCLLVVIVLVILLVAPSYSLGYLYVKRYPLSWSQTLYGYYWGFKSICELLMRLVVLRLMKNLLHMHETSIMILSLLSISAAEIMYGMTTITWVIFLVPLVGFFGGVLGMCMRAYLSTLVQPDELGKVFAVFGSLESAAVLAASALYNTLYPHTLHVWPGLLFVVGASIVVIPLAITVWLKVSYSRSLLPYARLEMTSEADHVIADGKGVYTISADGSHAHGATWRIGFDHLNIG